MKKRFIYTDPKLPEGYYFLVDYQGNKIVDYEGNYIIAKAE